MGLRRPAEVVARCQVYLGRRCEMEKRVGAGAELARMSSFGQAGESA